MHLCGIYEHAIDQLTCKPEIETNAEQAWIPKGMKGGGGKNWEVRMDAYPLPRIKQITTV